MDFSSGISVALKSCGPDVANDLLCHGVATLLLQIQGVPCYVVSPLAVTHFKQDNSIYRATVTLPFYFPIILLPTRTLPLLFICLGFLSCLFQTALCHQINLLSPP